MSVIAATVEDPFNSQENPLKWAFYPRFKDRETKAPGRISHAHSMAP